MAKKKTAAAPAPTLLGLQHIPHTYRYDALALAVQACRDTSASDHPAKIVDMAGAFFDFLSGEPKPPAA